jgi:hypothetical protein
MEIENRDMFRLVSTRRLKQGYTIIYSIFDFCIQLLRHSAAEPGSRVFTFNNFLIQNQAHFLMLPKVSINPTVLYLFLTQNLKKTFGNGRLKKNNKYTSKTNFHLVVASATFFSATKCFQIFKKRLTVSVMCSSYQKHRHSQLKFQLNSQSHQTTQQTHSLNHKC